MKITSCKLSSVPLEKEWPLLTSEEIAFSELRQDEYFPFIDREQISLYISKSIEYGEKMAKECVPRPLTISEIINQIIKKKISIQFLEQDIMNSWTRAQYVKKPPTIRIYKSSVKQLQEFFKAMDTPIATEDIMALHLYHEWFHYLEEKKYGQTDALLPRVAIKKTGPFTHRRKIRKTREIAAHAFTQKALNLSWSPLLLDYLLLYNQKGLNKIEIRKKFQSLKNQYEKITIIEENGMEGE